MKTLKWAAALLISLLGSATQRPFLPQDQDHISGVFEFVTESNQPGSAIGFRVNKKEASQYKICFLGECVSALEQWQLLGSDSEILGDQIMILENQRHEWVFKKINMDASLFAKMRKATQLRLPAYVAKRIDARADLIRFERAYNRQTLGRLSKIHWAGLWNLPVRSKVTSPFGAFRVTPDGETYYHKGVDLRASPGTPVHAVSDGIVASTDQQTLSGNMITIDHGYGVMSRYFHLSEFKVLPGTKVKAGDVIGLSGATGRVEAPHLHWELWVRGRPVDPLSTVRLLARLSRSG